VNEAIAVFDLFAAVVSTSVGLKIYRNWPKRAALLWVMALLCTACAVWNIMEV
jgi:hypothetical protein